MASPATIPAAHVTGTTKLSGGSQPGQPRSGPPSSARARDPRPRVYWPGSSWYWCELAGDGLFAKIRNGPEPESGPEQGPRDSGPKRVGCQKSVVAVTSRHRLTKDYDARRLLVLTGGGLVWSGRSSTSHCAVSFIPVVAIALGGGVPGRAGGAGGAAGHRAGPRGRLAHLPPRGLTHPGNAAGMSAPVSAAEPAAEQPDDCPAGRGPGPG
jgi:hypothetical protein